MGLYGNVLSLWRLLELEAEAMADGNRPLARQLRKRHDELSDVELVCRRCGSTDTRPVWKVSYPAADIERYACNDCDATGRRIDSEPHTRYDGDLAHPTWRAREDDRFVE